MYQEIKKASKVDETMTHGKILQKNIFKINIWGNKRL